MITEEKENPTRQRIAEYIELVLEGKENDSH